MRWLKQHVIKPVTDTFTQFGLDDGYLLAAGVAYYVGLSFFPLLWVLIWGLTNFFEFTHVGQDAKEEVLDVIALNASPGVAIQVRELLKEAGDKAGTGGWIGITILLVAVGTIFAQFERAFDRIWRFTPPEDLGWIATLKSLLIERVTAFALLIGVGALLVLTSVAATVLESIQKFASDFLPLPPVSWTVVKIATTVSINTLAFAVLYHTLPRARVKWIEAVRGGAAVAIVWELGRQVLASYLIGERYSVYGVAGTFIAIQLWAYYVVTIILLGAEYVRVTCKHCSGEGRYR